MRAIVSTLAVLLLLVGSASAQSDLQRAFDDMEDGRVRFSFETREGVYGDGRSIITRDFDDDDEDWDWDCDCTAGPARVTLTVHDGQLRRVRTRVGGKFRPAKSDEVDLGNVDPLQAADFLLHLAETQEDGDAEDAVFAATLAKGFDDWERMIDIARDRRRPEQVRESAIFWLGQAAGEAMAGTLEKLVDDDDTELEIREHAIFALSQRHESEALPALMRVVRKNPHPQLREKALFWMAQIDDPRVVDLFEEILLNR